MNIEEIKPCPFCGSPPATDGVYYYCSQGLCTCHGINATREYWNNRPIETALRKRIEELESWQAKANTDLIVLDETLECVRKERDSLKARIATLEEALRELADAIADIPTPINFHAHIQRARAALNPKPPTT